MSRTPILIKCHPGGLVEVFAPVGEVSVQIIDIPDVGEFTKSMSVEGQIEAELIIEANIEAKIRFPQRPLNRSSCLIASHRITTNVWGIFWRQVDLACVAASNQLRKLTREHDDGNQNQTKV